MVGSNITDSDGTANNKMGFESNNSIVVSVEASTYLQEMAFIMHIVLFLTIPCCFFFFFQKVSMVRCFERETSFPNVTEYQAQSHSWGRYTVLVDVVIWAQEWALLLTFSAGNFFWTVCILWFVLWSLCWLKFNFIHPHPQKEWKENWDVRLVDLLFS